MSKAVYQDFRKALIGVMTNAEFVEKIGHSKKEIIGLVERINLKEAFTDALVKEDSVCCLKLMDYCMPVLADYTEASGEEVLKYICDWCKQIMFPCNFQLQVEADMEFARMFFCQMLRAFIRYEKEIKEFNPVRHFDYVGSLEAKDETQIVNREYDDFLRLVDIHYMEEYMRISAEITPFDTLGHVAGVHHVSMFMARQLEKLGKPVNLRLMSGAAALHDVGKFGCRPEENKRIPYLHYYYTDRYTKINNIPVIGHIATNHSTWDLELEDLSIENLLLIYADFRVKSTRLENGKEQVNFYSLTDSFDVILSKLDNVDEAKKNRYKLVYARLKDFEDYMINLGVCTECVIPKVSVKNGVEVIDYTSNIENINPCPRKQMDYVLMSDSEIVKQMKYMAIDHNIYVMRRLTSEVSLRNILEAARSDKDWRNIRAYMNILQEYFTYLTHSQTHLAMQFVYEMLIHNEVDIRRQSANLIGKMILNYDREYRKELPQDVSLVAEDVTGFMILDKLIESIVTPDIKVTEQHRKWLGYALRRIVDAIINDCSEEARRDYIRILLPYYSKKNLDSWNTFILLDTARVIDYSKLNDDELLAIADFTISCNEWNSVSRQHNSITLLIKMIKDRGETGILERYVKTYMLLEAKDDPVTLLFLRDTLAKVSGVELDRASVIDRIESGEDDLLAKMFLDNLKVAKGATGKQINISIMQQLVESHPDSPRTARIATHLCNLMSASHRLTVREAAGELLVNIMKHVPTDQCNEMTIELTESLISAEYQYAKYVPKYLGRMVLYLPPNELDELVNDNFYKMVNEDNTREVIYTLHTIGTILGNYPKYSWSGDDNYESRKEKLVGYIMKGLVHYKESIGIEALNVLGHEIFGSDSLTISEKQEFYISIQKHLISAIKEQAQDALAFFNRASALSYIYSFITDYEFSYGEYKGEAKKRVAFFPGTFDPFSLGHKGIVEAVKAAGFQVYLAIDEFSWSKKTQPKLIRRQIARMSVADIQDVYLFPDEESINIANPSDLAHLKELFKGKELYIVTGLDVIAHASAYQAPPVLDSIYYCNHIVFTRKEAGKENTLDADILLKQNIGGKVVKLELNSELDDVSSSKIRENIDMNRDISNLIDPLCQRFIYENSIYLREPQYKELHVEHEYSAVAENVKLRYKEVSSRDLYEEFEDTAAVNYIRRRATVRLAVISGFEEILGSDENIKEYYLEIALAEALADCLRLGFTHGVCRLWEKELGASQLQLVEGILTRHGFLQMPSNIKGQKCYFVDMSYPLVLIQNMVTVLKAPFNTNTKVLDTVMECNRNLCDAFAKLYPGCLVLSLDAQLMNQRMLELITYENHVPNEQLKKRVLGKKMCVPFGKILRDIIVPNTVTKAIYTEKVYSRDASSTRIEEYPRYSPLATQINTLKSFNRPVILADDILHKGDRIKKLYPMLINGDVKVNKLIVGILSGHGTDLSMQLKLDVDSVYYIPNIKAWFQESTLYPFIGGDMIETIKKPGAGLLPSINQILPYVIPQFMPDLEWNSFYNLSLTCLNNTKKLLKVLEREYQREFGRNLTLGRLGEAVRDPYMVDQGNFVEPDLSVPASEFVENDIVRMAQLKNLVD